MRQQQQNQQLCLVQDIIIALRQQTEPAPVVQNQVIQVGIHHLAVVGVAIADIIKVVINAVINIDMYIVIQKTLDVRQ
jgi:hypothetical protein